MSKVINLHAAGVIKNGEKVASLDYSAGSTSIWDLALCKINGTNVLFSKHSSGGTYSISSLDQIANFVRDNQDSPAALAIIDAVKPYAVSATSSAGYAYATDATETGLYFDGVNKITTAPATIPTTTDLMKQLLGGTGSSSTGTATDPTTPATPFYKKPLVWIGVAVVAVIGYFAWKNK